MPVKLEFTFDAPVPTISRGGGAPSIAWENELAPVRDREGQYVLCFTFDPADYTNANDGGPTVDKAKNAARARLTTIRDRLLEVAKAETWGGRVRERETGRVGLWVIYNGLLTAAEQKKRAEARQERANRIRQGREANNGN